MTKKILFAVLLGIFLLAGLLYFKSAGRAQCVFAEYEQFDSLSGEPLPRAGPDGGPDMSIAYQILLPAKLKAGDRFVKASQLISCEDSYASANRLAYVELRGQEVSRAIQAWRAGKEKSSGFLAGDMLYESPLASYREGGRSRRLWDPVFALKHAPAWFDQSRAVPAHFIAFWGDGYLFQGEQAEQYFWFGFKS